jgi:hypothetical protein
MNKVTITTQGSLKFNKKTGRNFSNNQQFVYLGVENTKLLGFNEIVFSSYKMQIRRAGIDDNDVKKISNSGFSTPIDYNLLGEYELVKIHDELFQLVKIEEK